MSGREARARKPAPWKRLLAALADGMMSLLVGLRIGKREEKRIVEDGRYVGAGIHKQIQRHLDMMAEIERTGTSKQARILEVGCGSGWLAKRLNDNGYADISACDWIDAGRLGSEVREAIDFTQVDLNSKGLAVYKSASFDMVVSSNVIEHLESPSFILREIARVLKPGGVAIVSFPNAFNLFERINILLSGNAACYSAEATPTSYGHISMLSSNTLTSLAQRAGLDLVAKIKGYCYYRGVFLFRMRRFGHLLSHNAAYRFHKLGPAERS